jgi:hypothetical protein
MMREEVALLLSRTQTLCFSFTLIALLIAATRQLGE